MGYVGYVHYCVFCGHAADADSATMLEPSCPGCGCPLRACERPEYPALAAELADQRQRRAPRADGAGPLAAMTAGPFLLPIVGVEIRNVIFAVPVVFLIFAAVLAASASKRPGEQRGAWLAYAAAAGIAAATAGLAIVLEIAGADLTMVSHAGAAASVALVAGVWLHLRPHLRHARLERVLDAAQLLVLVFATTVYFVLSTGGDTIARAVAALDLVAFVGAGLLAVAGRRRQDARVGYRLWTMTACILLADSLAVTGGAAEASAALYAVAAWLLAGAAVSDRPAPTAATVDEDRHAAPERRWFAARILLPTVQLLAFPAVLALALAGDGPDAPAIACFGGAFVVVVLLAFARQTYLLVDHRRAVIDERRVRRAAQRRNEELEALTGLATTMTQTLEEAPIVEQALTVLHTAARATSSALHVRDEEGRRRLRASAGLWQAEHPWADRSGDGQDVERFVRGGRQVTRLQLRARGHDIGRVTFIRPGAQPLGDRELELLRLLVDQMAIAIQNARDYREKLELAVRDPLTGIYNRRYFFEALEKEVQRSIRYGSHAGLVLFDVDDFKRINDTRGHAEGDEVLRQITEVVAPLLRPVDSFARIGGEEFALLLPETRQLDALLVAERLRAAIGRDGVTVSAGVGSCPQDATTREDLVRRTDAAMYWAKRNGKDMCAVVDEKTEQPFAPLAPLLCEKCRGVAR